MKTFQCPLCKLHYAEEKWARQCKDFCRKYKSCSLEITKNAIENNPISNQSEHKHS